MARSTFILAVLVFFVARPSHLNAQTGKKTENVVKVAAKADKSAADGTQVITVTLTIEKGWHLYANPVGNDDLKSVQTEITINGTDKPQTTKTEYPKGKIVKDAVVGDYSTYEGTIESKLTIKRPAGSRGSIEIAVKCQACNDKSCLPQATIKVKVDTP
jgi:DsbC/DsbD-like thiol-disulfide interchange protein